MVWYVQSPFATIESHVALGLLNPNHHIRFFFVKKYYEAILSHNYSNRQTSTNSSAKIN